MLLGKVLLLLLELLLELVVSYLNGKGSVVVVKIFKGRKKFSNTHRNDYSVGHLDILDRVGIYMLLLLLL